MPPLRLVAMLLRPKQAYDIPIPPNIHNALEALRATLHPEHTNDGLEQLHQVFMAIWTCKWMPTAANPIPCPTVRALALLSLKRDAGFADPRNVTPIIAKLERAIRLTCLWEINDRSQRHHNGDAMPACMELRPWFTEKVQSPFNSLYSLQHQATGIAMGTISMPSIWWTDHLTWTRMLYKGHPISIDQVKEVFRKMEDSAVAMWEEKVLCGLDLHISPEDMTEDLTNKDVGYCFLMDTRNPVLNQRQLLINAILASPAHRNRFTLVDQATQKLCWNRIALRQWLAEYAEFEGVLLARAEMLSGAAGRATELTAMNYRSTQTRPERNLHVLGKYMAIVRKYHKGGNLSGMDKTIPHALDALTADLILQDLAIARPFAELAAQTCFPDKAEIQEVYRNRLFVNNTREFTTDDLSTIMGSFTMPIIGLKIGVAPWRHINIAWRRKLCTEASELLGGDGDLETVDALWI
jgi:uncharacterized protein (DUF2267 family)